MEKIAEIQIKSGVYLIVMLVSFDKFTMVIQEAGLGANGDSLLFSHLLFQSKIIPKLKV